MRTPSTPLARVALATAGCTFAVVLVGVLAGCGTSSPEAPSVTAPSTPATESPLTMPTGGRLAPGIRPLAHGRIQAQGIVRHMDLEGGFWALTKPAADPTSSKEDVVVIVVNADEVGLPSAEGEGVAVNGKLIEGASIRMAGPEMRADEILYPH